MKSLLDVLIASFGVVRARAWWSRECDRTHEIAGFLFSSRQKREIYGHEDDEQSISSRYNLTSCFAAMTAWQPKRHRPLSCIIIHYLRRVDASRLLYGERDSFMCRSVNYDGHAFLQRRENRVTNDFPFPGGCNFFSKIIPSWWLRRIKTSWIVLRA